MEEYALTEVLPGLFRIPVPLTGNPLKELNSYLFLKTDAPGSRNLLVDTGFRRPECLEAIRRGMRECGADPEETDVLLTHIHGDHIANASLLHRPGSKVYVGRRDALFLTAKSGGRNFPELLADSVTQMKRHRVDEQLLERMTSQAFSVIVVREALDMDYTYLDDGEELPAGRYTLRAVLTPGHTPGHLCFEILGTGAMLLGDHVLFDITPNITQWSGVEDSLGDYLSSLALIDAYPVTIPLPGHRHTGDFHARIAQIRSHHARRIRECFSVVLALCGTGGEPSPGRAYLYDIAGRMRWKIRTDDWEHFPPMQKWFALGECMSHLDYLRKRGFLEQITDGEGFSCYRPGPAAGRIDELTV